MTDTLKPEQVDHWPTAHEIETLARKRGGDSDFSEDWALSMLIRDRLPQLIDQLEQATGSAWATLAANLAPHLSASYLRQARRIEELESENAQLRESLEAARKAAGLAGNVSVTRNRELFRIKSENARLREMGTAEVRWCAGCPGCRGFSVAPCRATRGGQSDD